MRIGNSAGWGTNISSPPRNTNRLSHYALYSCSCDTQYAFDMRYHYLQFLDVLCGYFWPRIGHLRKIDRAHCVPLSF